MNSPLIPAEVIVQMNSVSRAYMTDSVSHAADINEFSDEEIGWNGPVMEIFYSGEGFAAVESMWNFTATEFDEILMVMSKSVGFK